MNNIDKEKLIRKLTEDSYKIRKENKELRVQLENARDAMQTFANYLKQETKNYEYPKKKKTT